MPTRPLLRLPNPDQVAVPKGTGQAPRIHVPSRARQSARFNALFDRLRSVLDRDGSGIELRQDPTSLAPERVLVFEIVGTVANFLKAVSRIEGLEFMTEYDAEFASDEEFVLQELDKHKVLHDRPEKAVPGRFYLAMPDVRAFKELLGLWERWKNDAPLGRGYAPFGHLFQQLRSLRPWGPQDRVPEETIAFWREQTISNPDRPVRTEVELWFRNSEARRREASETLHAVVGHAGGQVIHEAIIPEIAYHGLLIDLPTGQVQDLIRVQGVSIALINDVMFLRPQSLLRSDLDIETSPAEIAPPTDIQHRGAQPIAALIDGVPVQGHQLLAGRLILDDPDDLQSRATVSRRIHGTAMASLILHGDRNEGSEPLIRPLYVRPILIANENGPEQTVADRLFIDTVYRAVLRIKGSEGEDAVAPGVFLINLSIGDMRRPFAGIISPLARVLDFLSAQYGLLFLVSAGNISNPLEVSDFANWTDFQNAEPGDRERAVLKALNAAKHERTILSPAESLNSLTIGAQHTDSLAIRQGLHNAADPFQDNALPNVSSGLGLGYRRMVKPEVYLPGGREHVQMQSTGNGLIVSVSSPQRLYGLSTAAPDRLGQGRLNQIALSGGTSSATALATRASHRIFDALMDREGGSALADIDPLYYAVVVKALLVHSARWNGNDELLKDICGPQDKHRHVERSENACRFIGFGVPNVLDALECAANRATLVGFGELSPGNAHQFRIPLPGRLERVTDPRSLTITIAWLSPVKPGHQRYRGVLLEGQPLHKPIQVLGVNRRKGQPADPSVRRGSVFHEHFEGESAVPFIDDGHLLLRIWCKEDAGILNTDPVRYGIAVTIRAETDIPVYEEIQQRLRIRPQPPI